MSGELSSRRRLILVLVVALLHKPAPTLASLKRLVLEAYSAGFLNDDEVTRLFQMFPAMEAA